MQIDQLDIRLENAGNRGKYSIRMPNGEESKLTFVRVGPDHIIADHTFVPVPWRGKGVAERLVERLVADARAAGTRITPSCWFVADEFARRGEEWDDVLKR
jgi:predicted GNAT family acetyltransferase